MCTEPVVSEIQKAKDRACVLARAMLQSDESYLDNVVELNRLGHIIYTEVWSTEFHIFGVLSSDTDHLPLSHVRPRCSAAMLARSDQELSEIVETYRKDVTDACKFILAAHAYT